MTLKEAYWIELHSDIALSGDVKFNDEAEPSFNIIPDEEIGRAAFDVVHKIFKQIDFSKLQSPLF